MTETHVDIGEGECTNESPTTFMGKVKYAHRHSSGPVDLLQQLWLILTTSCGFLALIIIVIIIEVLPIAMIIVGAIFKDDCPAEPYIPIYLIVAGVFGAIEALGCTRIFMANNRVEEERSDETESKKSNVCYSCYHTWSGLFTFCWFIAGNVWVYGTSPVFSNTTSANYCNYGLYTFAFWVVTLPYIFLGIIFIVMPLWACCVACGYACCAACCGKS